MARLLGDRVLPEFVQRRRQSLRERAMDLRDPIRRQRAQNVPGPNLIGEFEGTVTDLRDRFVRREGIMSRIRARRNGEENGNGEGESNNNNGGGANSGTRGSNTERQSLV